VEVEDIASFSGGSRKQHSISVMLQCECWKQASKQAHTDTRRGYVTLTAALLFAVVVCCCCYYTHTLLTAIDRRRESGREGQCLAKERKGKTTEKVQKW